MTVHGFSRGSIDRRCSNSNCKAKPTVREWYMGCGNTCYGHAQCPRHADKKEATLFTRPVEHVAMTRQDAERDEQRKRAA